MSEGSLNREVALRIGLAARTLGTVSPAQLLEILDSAVGLPPTKKKLTGLKLDALRRAGGETLLAVDPEHLALAHKYLRGEVTVDAGLPEIEAYRDGDLPDSIRVACASDAGEEMNGHFGSCARFLIYQVSADDLRLVDIRSAGEPEDVDDKNAYRAGLIGDCQVLFVVSIGGPAAAKVVRAGVHPVKKPQTGPAREVVAGLQPVLQGTPPPWLAKVMGHSPEDRIRFTSGAEE